nr:MAG TPA: syndecan-2 protein [Caudoviricetes sp.]
MIAIIILLGVMSIICSVLLVMTIAFKLFNNKEDKEK